MSTLGQPSRQSNPMSPVGKENSQKWRQAKKATEES